MENAAVLADLVDDELAYVAVPDAAVQVVQLAGVDWLVVIDDVRRRMIAVVAIAPVAGMPVVAVVAVVRVTLYDDHVVERRGVGSGRGGGQAGRGNCRESEHRGGAQGRGRAADRVERHC